MEEYIQLLRSMIQTPSFSREEGPVADLVRNFLTARGVDFQVKGFNTWARNQFWHEGKPVVLLNSHIDTVKPSKNWTKDPFGAVLEGDCLVGLGSNDAGASLVSLMAVFNHFYAEKDLPFNLIFAASCEEEISGPNGMENLVPELGEVSLAIVGEPTQMQMAIAEKGLMVLDCTAHGKAGHAARNEGENALYKAVDDIQILRNYRFGEVSEVLGEVKMSITQINAGYQHNVVPDTCSYVVDVRINEFYSNQAAFEIIAGLVGSTVVPRSTRLNSSGIPVDHPIVERGLGLGLSYYGSPTTSDQAVMPFPSIKIGPGDSARSHTADEYILISEIENGFKIYIDLLTGLHL
ncbi:M20 family metallo-hydrolase [Mangrovibacterium marinum]|uniref:Acetylornithine deacetylase n=1 Tax=Mangrovibacterium marinum TaxID=1639118 RepID=A0A2T5C1V8_9BACT|nr:M20 family metallo-hydrolase [Mangrovibacterium marinum]PTN08588.1 acetylornithine deacetylase [Mangrovibacterium marinum]